MTYKIYGQHDEKTRRQMETCMNTGSAAAGVLCADGHLGYAHPIGGVVGYTDHISISGVGFDIACGNMAIRLDTPYAEIAPRIGAILQDTSRVVSFGVGRKNEERVDHALFESDLWRAADVEDLKSMARAQLGTVGSGNHYVDIFEDESGATWIGVHFGSRGLGHKITTKYLAMADAKDGKISVYIEPVKKDDKEDSAFSTPFRCVGTAAELSAELPQVLSQWVATRAAVVTSLSKSLAESEAAIKAAAEEARKKAAERSKKPAPGAKPTAPAAKAAVVQSATPSLLDGGNTDDDDNADDDEQDESAKEIPASPVPATESVAAAPSVAPVVPVTVESSASPSVQAAAPVGVAPAPAVEPEKAAQVEAPAATTAATILTGDPVTVSLF